MMVDKDRYKAVVTVLTDMIHNTLNYTKLISVYRGNISTGLLLVRHTP